MPISATVTYRRHERLRVGERGIQCGVVSAAWRGYTYVGVPRGRAVKQEVGDGAPRARREYLSPLALGVGPQAPHQALRLAQPRTQLRAALRRAAVAATCRATRGCYFQRAELSEVLMEL